MLRIQEGFPQTRDELREWDALGLIEFKDSDMLDRVVADILARIRVELTKK